ncbi:MAG TPA: Crp/Fnr family transcriptional regulator [Thiolinea sp.]|nr:Crp/Fnr family transcriptional regulator [Thiolinea sp.]
MPSVKGKGHCLSCPIRHLSIFGELPTERLGQIQPFQPAVLQFQAGETIYHQGAMSQSAYTLRKGMVKLSKSLANGRTQIIRVIGAGELFGFDGFADEAYSHSATPLCTIEVCRLPFADLANLKRQYAEIDTAMTQRWLRYLRQAENQMLALGVMKAPERLASFLVNWYDSGTATEQGVALPLARGEIGELLGLTIETVSRFISEWKRQGLISETKGYLKLLDRQVLLKAACSD